jgi:hypothetical protein
MPLSTASDWRVIRRLVSPRSSPKRTSLGDASSVIVAAETNESRLALIALVSERVRRKEAMADDVFSFWAASNL